MTGSDLRAWPSAKHPVHDSKIRTDKLITHALSVTRCCLSEMLLEYDRPLCATSIDAALETCHLRGRAELWKTPSRKAIWRLLR
jgi:hypothetical protein